MQKITVGMIYGGKSTEHEISILSAKGIVNAMDQEKYQLAYIYINKQGKWFLQNESQFQQQTADDTEQAAGEELVIDFGHGADSIRRASRGEALHLDIIFSIIHGSFGEDGCLQGVLRMAEIPFVGSDVLGSAVGMDKEVSKRLLDQAGIPNARYMTLYAGEPVPSYEDVQQKLGTTLFVKPVKQGSSVGISKVKNQAQWAPAVDEAFRYDDKVLVEEFIDGREVEVSVLGNRQPQASLPGEIIPNADFYSYDAKYVDAEGAKLMVPADLPSQTVESIRALAVKTYRTLCCEGMTRVDFFVRGDELFINEVNTLPGFTRISMYPKLWEATGMPMTKLIDQLIDLGLERFQKQTKMQRSFAK